MKKNDGIIISNDMDYRGIAPGSKIVALRGIGGTLSDTINSIQWCIDNKPKVLYSSFAIIL